MNKQGSPSRDLELRPPVPPFEEDHLTVSDLHKIRYALYGNPKGVPVFFLHGGPGCGCNDDDARWFDPDKYLVVTHDQRGGGKSLPRAEIRDNTPHDLVSDIERLRHHLNIGIPLQIFAGSWGTTLALLYAEANPSHVSKMLLRGVFTCGWKDQDYFYSESGAARFSPEAWEKFVTRLPHGEDRIQERLHRLIEDSKDEDKRKWCAIQSEYEYSFFDVVPGSPDDEISAFEATFPEMRINSHYQANRFFLEDEQILNNANLIENIPTTIVHGARDVICPPIFAWKLHKRLARSRLVIVKGGDHLSSDPGIQQALLRAVIEWDATG